MASRVVVFLQVFLLVLYSIDCNAQIPSNALPNCDLVGRGFNSLSGDPLIAAMKNSQNVLALSWSQNQTVPTQEGTFAIPDNFKFTAFPTTTQATVAQVFTSLASVAEGNYQAQSQGFTGVGWRGITLIPGMYSGSAQASYFQQKNQQGYYSGFSFLQVNVWQLQLNLDALVESSFDPDFLSILSKLPSVFSPSSSSCTSFKNFFTLFGTHFLPALVFGGQSYMESYFEESVVQSKGAQAVQQDLSTQFLLMTSTTALTDAQQQQLTSLQATYFSQLNALGGDNSIYTPNNWPVWAQTVPSNPTPLSGLLIPHFSLPVNWTSAQQSQALEDATRAYLLNPSSANQNTWAQFSSLPTARDYLAAAATDTLVYAIGGWTANAVYSNIVEAYDPTTNAWTSIRSMPTARAALTACSVNDTIYAIGGWSGSDYSSAVESYDPSVDKWFQLASLPTPRDYLAAATTSDGKIFVIGGSSAINTVSSSNEVYDPIANQWQTMSPMPTPRASLAVVSVNDVIYALGGFNGTVSLDTFESYDPSTDTWTILPPMPYPRSEFSASIVFSVIYVMGGYPDPSSVYSFDTVTGKWAVLSDLSVPRTNLASASLDGIIYAVGGTQSDSTSNSMTGFYPSLFC